MAATESADTSRGPVVEPVTVVVTRQVRKGAEADYEHWLKGVTSVVARYPGFLGINVFRPTRPDDPWTFVYKFDSGEHLDRWLASSERADWVKRGEALCVGDTVAQHVSGLETWFKLPGARAMVPPPKWKMAVVSGAVVYPTSMTVGMLIGPVLGFLPAPLVALCGTAITVTLMTWVLMPQVTRLLAPWLFTQK